MPGFALNSSRKITPPQQQQMRGLDKTDKMAQSE